MKISTENLVGQKIPNLRDILVVFLVLHTFNEQQYNVLICEQQEISERFNNLLMMKIVTSLY